MSWSIAVDFDRSLAVGDPLRWLPGAKDGLLALLRGGASVVIHSCRATPPSPRDSDAARETFYAVGSLPEEVLYQWLLLEDMRSFLRRESVLELVSIWESPGKPQADAFIDDRSERPDWDRVAREFGVT